MKSRISVTLLSLLIFINMAVMVSDYKAISNKVGAICSILIMLLLLYYNKGYIRCNKNEGRLYICIFLFLLYYTATSLLGGNFSNTFESVLYFLIEFSSIFIVVYMREDGEKKDAQKKLLINLFFVVWDIFCVAAIVTYIRTPNLARLMAAYRSSYSSLIIGGGYPMAYGSAVLGVYLFQSILQHADLSRKYRVFAIFEIILLTVLVYLTNSFVILVAMLLGFVLCFFRHTLKGSLYILSVILLVTLSLIVYFNLEGILEWILKVNNNEFIEKRIFELYNLVANDVTSYHLNKRSDLYTMSFTSFLQHPIFGVGYTFGNVGSLQRLNGIGAHSTILDALGQYGLVGSVPLFGIILFPFVKNKELKYSSIYLLPFLFMLFMNPCFTTYHFILVSYLIIPLIQDFTERGMA